MCNWNSDNDVYISVCVCVCVCENTWILSEYLAGNCVYVIVRVCVRERERESTWILRVFQWRADTGWEMECKLM